MFRDWRLGEQYFARKLLDYDMASNVGGWQWSSSTGCDAAPYFRIFSLWSQSRKFDSDAMFIKKWVPELINIPAKAIHDPLRLKESLVTTYGITHNVYMSPIVDYKFQRQVALRNVQKGKRCLKKFFIRLYSLALIFFIWTRLYSIVVGITYFFNHFFFQFC